MMRCGPRRPVFAAVDLASKGTNSVSDQPTRDPIVLRLTPVQKEHYFRRTGMILHSVSVPPAQLRRFSGVAAKAGSESLPVSRSAVRQLLEPEPPREPGGAPVAHTPAPHPT